MPRKARTTAPTSTLPFTTFAAATAQALSQTAPPTITAWETESLTLLKKLSKRDATTKLKALAELSAHLDNAPTNASHFLNSFSTCFPPLVLNDPSSAVRAAALNLTQKIVLRMRNNVQPIFADILPVWVGATGDEIANVRTVAASTLEQALGEKKPKVVARYEKELKAFCTQGQEARVVVAVLKWLVQAGVQVWNILETRLQKIAKNARPETCDLIVIILNSMQHETAMERVDAMMRVGLKGIEEEVHGGWDVLLTLITKGYNIDLKFVAKSVRKVITREIPTGVDGLLALIVALAGRKEGEEAVKEILEGVKSCILKGRSSYVWGVLEGYLECVQFLIGSGKWSHEFVNWVQMQLAMPVVLEFCEGGIVAGDRVERIGRMVGRVLEECGEDILKRAATVFLQKEERFEMVMRGMQSGVVVREVIRGGCETADSKAVARGVKAWKETDNVADERLLTDVTKVDGSEEEMGEILSWVFWGGGEVGKEWSVAVWNQILDAHKRRRGWNGWSPIAVNDVVSAAVETWDEENIALLVKVVDPLGGGTISAKILRRVAEEVVKRDGVGTDDVLEVLLKPVDRLRETGMMEKVLQVAILAHKEQVQDGLVQVVSELSEEEAQTSVNGMFRVLQDRNMPNEYAQVFARVVARVEDCEKICAQLLQQENPHYTRALLEHVPVSRAFTDETQSIVQFLQALQIAEHPDQLVRDFTNKDELIHTAMQCDLDGEEGLQLVLSGVQIDEMPLDEIAENLASVIKEGGKRLQRVPAIVAFLRERRDDMQQVVAQAVNAVRRDPFSQTATGCVNILAAIMSADAPEWLVEKSETALVAVRRALERTRSVNPADVQRLEGAAARLVAVSGEIGDDDVRFWGMRVADVLRAEVERGDGDLERLGNVLMLAKRLVERDVREDIRDRILHYGAWGGARYLREGGDDGAFQACEGLVVSAVESEVLMGGGVTVPFEVDRVYGLIKRLGSESKAVRRACLMLIRFASAVDVVERVGKLEEDEWEMEVIEEVIPKELRDGMVGDGELGVFGAWRVFLELIGGGEGVTFRRVAIEYLKAKPELFGGFLENAVDVVVNGSAKERAAAGEAAVEALGGGRGEGREKADEEDMQVEVGRAAGIALARALQRLPALSREVVERMEKGMVGELEAFVRSRIAPLLMKGEIDKVKEWGAFGGGNEDGIVHAKGSVSGGGVRATYTFSDVTLEIGLRIPDTFPLGVVEVEAGSRVGMTEARWRKTLLAMTILLRGRDGSLAEAVELWRRNLDRTFEGREECPICYSVLHLISAELPKMQCRTCRNSFHSECLVKWFRKSNSSACPMCRTAFQNM